MVTIKVEFSGFRKDGYLGIVDQIDGDTRGLQR